jgi:hypothetical protein
MSTRAKMERKEQRATGGLGGKKGMAVAQKICQYFIFPVSFDPVVDVSPHLRLLSHSLNKTFSLDMKPSQSFFSPGFAS